MDNEINTVDKIEGNIRVGIMSLFVGIIFLFTGFDQIDRGYFSEGVKSIGAIIFLIGIILLYTSYKKLEKPRK